MNKPDHQITIHIDRKPYQVDAEHLTGRQIRALPNPDISSQYELKLDCRDVGGRAVATGTFKNKTGTAQGFQVDIDFETNGVRFDQQTQFLTTVRNGAKTAIEAKSSVLIPEGELRCSGTVRRSLFDNLDGTFPAITAVG